MTVLAYNELVHLLDSGVIEHGRLDAVGGASIDLHLGPKILVEFAGQTVDYRERTPLDMFEIDISGDDGYLLKPGQFILAHSVEFLRMPLNIMALLRTKSSQGRMGWEHADSGIVDPGFHGQLTLEFTNITQRHPIRIRAGDTCAQLVFMRHEMVEYDNSYLAKGRYNGQTGVNQTRKENDARRNIATRC